MAASRWALNAAIEAMKTPLGWMRGIGPGDGSYTRDVTCLAEALDAAYREGERRGRERAAEAAFGCYPTASDLAAVIRALPDAEPPPEPPPENG